MRIAVYCGSSPGDDPSFLAAATDLGGELARRGIGVVYGGGHVGLMGAVADAALTEGGEVIGVITRSLVEAEVAHDGLSELRVVESMHERKAAMASLADAVIVLPGGYGTLDEALEMLTWNQLGIVAQPVVFVDVGGFYASLFDFFDRAQSARLLRGHHRQLARRAATAARAIDLALEPAVAVVPKWLDRA